MASYNEILKKVVLTEDFWSDNMLFAIHKKDLDNKVFEISASRKLDEQEVFKTACTIIWHLSKKGINSLSGNGKVFKFSVEDVAEEQNEKAVE